VLPFSVHKAPEFKDLVHSTQYSPIQLKSDEFHEATPESMFRFLKRIKIVMESRSIYWDTVEGKCFVGILGAEDIGKSTFIMVSKYPPFFDKLTTNPRLFDHSYLMNCSHNSSSVHHCAFVCNI
jgi:hypothetical protein